MTDTTNFTRFVMDEPDWMDDDDTCQRCGGEGLIVTCIDDMCYGQDYCIHGDGETTCPDCGGSGFRGGQE